MAVQGEGHRIPVSSPLYCGLASRADRLFLPLLSHSQRPLEHREGDRLALAAVALRLDQLPGPFTPPMRTPPRWKRVRAYAGPPWPTP